MQPSVGRIVHYTLTKEDQEQIHRRRTDGNSIRERIAKGEWPVGAQAHVGLESFAGDVLPMIITHVGAEVHGQVFLNGNDTLFVTEVNHGDGRGEWRWPEKV